MPRKNFENIGVLQGYEYIRGVITDDPDFDTDTCTVSIKNAEGDDVEYSDTPIFYHCSEDAEEREDNGAIEGGAAGFAKDDEVIVLKQRQGAPGHDGEQVGEPKIFVIAHVDGIRSCCWSEPWDYDEELSTERVDYPGRGGTPVDEPSAFTIEQLSPDHVWVIQDPGNISDVEPYKDYAFTFTNENGALKIYKPEFVVIDDIPTTYPQFDFEGTYVYPCSLSFPYPLNSDGHEDPPAIFKASARRIRVTVSDVITECWERQSEFGGGTRFAITIQGKNHDTGVDCEFEIFFFTEAALSKSFTTAGDNIATRQEGMFCWCDQLSSPSPFPVEHQYQTEFAKGSLWWNVYSWRVQIFYGEITEDDVQTYFAYLPPGTDNAQWLDFPYPVDINRVEIVVYVNSHVEDRGDGHEQGTSPEFTAIIDNIEIC